MPPKGWRKHEAAREPNPAKPGRVEVPRRCDLCQCFELDPRDDDSKLGPMLGTCIRFPAPVRKRRDQKCWEFRAKEGES